MTNMDEIVEINGHRWRVLRQNETAAGATYPMKDVIACGGRVPHYFTVSNDGYESPPPNSNRSDRRGNKPKTWKSE